MRPAAYVAIVPDIICHKIKRPRTKKHIKKRARSANNNTHARPPECTSAHLSGIGACMAFFVNVACAKYAPFDKAAVRMKQNTYFDYSTNAHTLPVHSGYTG